MLQGYRRQGMLDNFWWQKVKDKIQILILLQSKASELSGFEEIITTTKISNI